MLTSASVGQGWSCLLRPGHEANQRSCWSEAIWWAWEDLNLRLHPYQQNAGNRCADGRFRTSRATVGVEVKCSNSLQLSALPTRPEPCRHCTDHCRLRQYAKPLHRYLPAHTPPSCHLSIPLPPPSALPHQPDLHPLTFRSSHCPLLVPSKSNTRQQCSATRMLSTMSATRSRPQGLGIVRSCLDRP